MSARALPLHPDSELHAYVIGVAIGDGNLSNPNGRAVRLRVTWDTKYPALLGFHPRLYRVRQSPEGDTLKYHVRLSRQVRAFLDLVAP